MTEPVTETIQETKPEQASASPKTTGTHILKMTMNGFKSFGKHTELLFGDNFNVVLGPNGSGKSNVIDALCFVLGKSSSKSLRAEKSAHLIYNGGKKKQPAKTAEVTITFDNKNKTFPLPEEEIKVSRIVREDGMSRYRINNETKTRQEIVELLSHAKIDPDGYNIILQGDIVRLVEMNALERRQIIEEIAGISLYEEKKQQAINELTKVDEKLNEADIILKEREGYLKDLRKDRDQAIEYKDLQDKLKTGKASHLKLHIDRKHQDLNTLNTRMNKHKETLTQLQEKISIYKNQITEKKQRITHINEEIEKKGEIEQVQLQREIETIRIDIATLKTKISSTETEYSKLLTKKEHLQKQDETLKEKFNETTGKEKDLTAQHDAITEKIKQFTTEIDNFKKKNKLGEDQTLHTQIEDIDKNADILQKEIQTLREKQQQTIREKDKLDFQTQTIDSQIAKIKQVEEEHKTEINTLKQKKIEFKKILLELNDVLNADSTMAGKLAELKQSLTQFQEEQAKLSVKQFTIKEHLASNLAVTKILESGGKLGTIHGTVSNLGSTPNKYSQALEIAASQRIHSIVVDDDKTATRCIKHLKDNKFGVATFLPLNKIKGQPITTEERTILKTQGVIGFAIDLITYDPQFKNVFSYVFGSTLIIDKIETARNIGVGNHRMVTLDGDLCELSGAMIGGYRLKKTGSFKNEDITTKIQHVNERITTNENYITELVEKRQQNEEKVTKLREIKVDLEADIIKTEKTLHINTGDLDASHAFKEDLLKKQKELTKEIQTLDNTAREKLRELSDYKIKKQQLRDHINQLNNPTLLAELTTLETKKKELDNDLNIINQQQQTLHLQKEEVLKKQEETNKQTKKDLAEQEQQILENIQQWKKTCREKTNFLTEKEKEQQQFMTNYKALFEERNNITTETNKLETKMLEKEEIARKEEFDLNIKTLEETKIKTEIGAFELEFSNYTGVPLTLNKNEETLQREIAECERKLSHTGPVNMRALDIYDAAEKEYNTLQEKKSKLGNEKNSVINLMQEIETQKKDLFIKSLDVVNKNFVTIFSQLTTKGSSASLDLETPDNPFEGGLRIKVRLTGQKYLDIRSLSGGEKTMTALAFLFAIQEHEPASFYILDEVDAALDKANSEKLAQLIRQYTSKAQYIVISHNDALIAEADTLFGVSMHTDLGASTIVSVKA